MHEDLEKILVGEDAILRRVGELAEQICADYTAQGVRDISIVCITNGAIIFTADLIRRMTIRLRLDCVRASTYGDDDKPIQDTQIIDHIRMNVKGQHVLMIDDILDTGRTCSKIVASLEELEPTSIKTCMLLDKQGRREVPFEADYVGFKIPNEFVVGYGLDFADSYRNLSNIGVLKAELQNPPTWQ